VEIKKGQQQFYIGDREDVAIARITFEWETEHVIVANHTYVDEALRGQQVAKKLLDVLVSYARENNLKIRPLCSYVVKAFERYEEYQDIIA
jgi:uncharacterized protein